MNYFFRYRTLQEFLLTTHVFLVCACLVLVGQIFAQSVDGRVVGVIQDASGAILPGVSVSLTHRGTGEIRTAATDETGSYRFLSVRPGDYSVTVEKIGFKKAVKQPVTVLVNQVASIDFDLETGAVTEVMEVTATAPLLEKQTSTLGHVVEQRQIIELPLNGRNTIGLAELSPGVNDQGGFGKNPAVTNFNAWGNFSANGGLANANEILVEGAPVTIPMNNSVGFVPPVDGTQEFKVQTNNYSAEFGRSSGGLVNLTLKSGTNTLHGSAYEFFRNGALDANDFFLNRAGQPRPHLTYNQFGGTLGGPIIKGKTFYFGLYEGYRQRQGIPLVGTVPTLAQRQGDFSQTFNAQGQLIKVYDPLTTRRVGSTIVRDQFIGNTIPASRLDPVAKALVNLIWPLPNTAGSQFTNLNNFATSAVQPINSDQFTVKVDHSFNDSHKVYGSYSQQWFDIGGYDPLRNNTTTTDWGRNEDNRNKNVTLTDVYTLSPTSILEVRLGYLRFDHTRIPPSTGFDLVKIGFPKALVDQLQFVTFPPVTVTGMQRLDSSTSSTIYKATNNYSAAGSLSFIRGKHSLKVGGQYRVSQLNDIQLNNATPNFTFTDNFTRLDPNRFTGTDGVGIASFMLGYPSAATTGKAERGATTGKYYAVYLQDDWNLRSNLTLNLGFRYDIEPYIMERYNRLHYFDYDLIPAKTAQYTKLPLRGGLRFADDDQRRPTETSYRQLGPRVGFAYTPFQKAVIRGGYGIFWLPSSLVNINTNSGNSAHSVTTNFVSSLDNGLTPADTLRNPFPNGILNPPGRRDGADSLIGNTMSTWVRDATPGYTQQWNFDLQYEFPHQLLVDVAYAGSKGTRLPVTLNLNQLSPEHFALGSQLNERVSNPFFGLVTNGTLAASTVTRGQLLRPFPHFLNVTASWAPVGNSTYHSLQTKISKRFGGGGLVTTVYTLSKTLSDTESKTGWLEPNGSNPAGYMNNYNRRLEKSLTNFDATHRLLIHYNVDLPFGSGHRFLSNLSGVTNWFVSGWQLNGITKLKSGTPLFISSSTNSLAAFGVTLSRPNIIGDYRLEGSAKERLSKWFNTAAFQAPAPFTFGNAARTLNVRTHGTANFDFSIFKNNKIGERSNLQFRAEFFNLFNRVQFGAPNTQQGNPDFGLVNQQVNQPRQIQFALKYLF